MKIRVRWLELLSALLVVTAIGITVQFLSGCAATRGRGITPMSISSLPGSGNQSRELAQVPYGGEELWVIARGSEPSQQRGDDAPGSGALLAEVEEKQIPMPLKHTDVQASISGYIGEVEVSQQFHNPYSKKIEAVYVFPLPHNAAVNEFIMVIGDRRIRGIIRERQEAEQIYRAARSQGLVASLLTEERPNVFTQSVANIEPGKEIEVRIKYLHTLDYVDGWYEFVFPMVVAPRFNPADMTTGIGAAGRGQRGASGQQTEVQYLKPGERTGHELSLDVHIDAGVPIEQFECSTHEVAHESASREQLDVHLQPRDRLPNKDFVLRYRVAGDRIKSSLLTHQDERGGFFTLMLYPPKQLDALERQPLELVFVIDCSGSMSGQPIAQAKAAVARGLQLLQPEDSFQLITFSMAASRLGSTPLEATGENVRDALKYLNSLDGEGGTMMIEGIKAALDFPHDPARLRFVCFLTDGFIGNEAEILREIHQRLGPSRIFSFGIGSSVNRFLIEQMGKSGRGAVAYLNSKDEAAQVMEDFFERISHPALVDIKIDWGGLKVTGVYPRAVPDLFVGRPVVLCGRFSGNERTALRVTGNTGSKPISLQLPVSFDAPASSHHGLPAVWARAKIADLASQSIRAPDDELPEQIRQIALDYGLMSPFTAFLAVDSASRTGGTDGVSVPVAVPVPDGVKYDTTVNER
jgi:Ca-activated chloride channel family protein